MAISPWAVGQLLPVWTVTFTDDSGATLNLTGATLTLQIRNKSSGAVTSGAGSFVVTSASTGLATYSPDAADVAAAGEYEVRGVATIGGKEVMTDWQYWEITA